MNLDAELRGLPTREAAFYVRLGLLLELLTLADVSDWVDEVLWREEEPEEFFLTLYGLLRTGKPRVPSYLKTAFPAETYPARPLLGWLQQQWATGRWPLSQLIRSLYRLRTLVQSDQEVGWIYALAADYEQAAGGPAEELLPVQQETEAFLACYREYTFANRGKWPQLDAKVEGYLANLRQ